MATADEIMDQVRELDGLGVTTIDPPIAEEPQTTERARGEDGRFVKKEADPPESAPTEPAAATTATPAPKEPAKQPETKPEGVTEEPVADAAADDIVPFQFRGSGMDLTIDGAMYKKGHGVFVPEAALDDLRFRLTHAAKFPKVRERAERAEEQLRSGVTRHQAENKALTDTIGFLFDGEKLARWLQEAAADPMLAADRLAVSLQRRHLAIERELQGKFVEGPSGNNDEQFVQDLLNDVEDTLSDVFSRVWPDASPADRSAVETAIGKSYQSFLTKADADDPHGRWVRGQVVPARSVMESFVRGERAARQTPPSPVQSRPSTPPKAAPAAKAPPSVAGPAKNIAGSPAGKPQPDSSGKAALDYFGLPAPR